MPSYLFQEQTPPIQPYQHPTELMLKAGMYRDAKVEEGLRNIRSKYDNLLSLQLTNPENQQFVREQIKGAVNQLDKYTSADLSLPENVGAVMSVFDPVTDDQGVLQDIAFTKHMNKQKSIIDKLSIDDPDKVSPANVFPILQAEQEYRSGNRNARPSFATFQPYYNYEKPDNDFLSKLKEDIYTDPEIINVKDPITGATIGLRGERQVKEIAKDRIRGALMNSFDAKKMSQMQLDYQYNKANGVYNQHNAALGLEQDIRDLKPLISEAKNRLTSGSLSPQQEQILQRQINDNEAALLHLTKLREAVQFNPQAADEYYSFNKYLNDYVNQKTDQYATRQVGQLEYNEFDKANQKFILDSHLENLKQENRIKLEQSKAKVSTAVNTSTGEQADGTFAYTPPLMKVLDDVAVKGTSQINHNSPALPALLGAIREPNGTLTYYNTGGGDKELDKQIIMKDSSGSIDPESAKILSVNSSIGAAIDSISKVDSSIFYKNVPSPIYGYGQVGIPGRQQNVESITPEAKVNILGSLLSKYKDNPNSVNAKYKPALEKLSKDLTTNGITTLDNTSMDQYSQFVGSDKGKSLIEIGVLLNKDAKGRYKFIPEGSDNIVGLYGDRLGVSGYFQVTKDDLKRMGLDGRINKLKEDGVLSQVAPDVVYNDDGSGKVVKTAPDTYYMSVVLPVTGDLNDINDKMFEDGDMKSLELKNQYPAKRMQSNAFKQYQQTAVAARTQLQPTGNSTFKPREGSAMDTEVKELLNRFKTNPSITPDQSRLAEDEFNIITSTPQSPVDAARNIQRYMSNLQLMLNAVNGSENIPSTTSNTTTETVPKSKQEFVRNYLNTAQEIERTSGIPVEVTLAQSALESAWGKSSAGNNMFGIKANSNWKGASQNLMTREVLNGTEQNLSQAFRDYPSRAESFRDYANFLRSNPRYANAFREKDPKKFAEAIAKAGYATSPKYADALKELIEEVAQIIKSNKA